MAKSAAGPQQTGDAGVRRRQRRQTEPVQRRRRHDGVERAVRRGRLGPVRRAEVGGNPREATVAIAVRPLPEQHQHRVVVERDHSGVREPVEDPHAERARAAAEVEHDRVVGAGHVRDRIEDHAEALLAIRHVRLLLAIPALEPHRSVDRATAAPFGND